MWVERKACESCVLPVVRKAEGLALDGSIDYLSKGTGSVM